MCSSMKLQKLFFDLTFDIVQNDCEQNSFIYSLEKIGQFVQVKYLSAYIHYDEYSCYRLLGSYDEGINLDLAEQVFSSEKQLQDTYFQQKLDGEAIEFLHLDLKSNSNLIVVIIKQDLTKELVDVLQKEFEKLFIIILEMERNSFYNKNNKILLDISTNLMKSNDKQVVLTKIVDALHQIYPNYEHYLFLTQEYNESKKLPIKTINFTNEKNESVVTQVFMNAEIQIKKLSGEKKKKVFAPLIGEQSVYGVLEMIIPDTELIRKEELQFINNFANLVGKALEKSILYEDSIKQVKNLTLLNVAIHELNSSSDLSEVVEIIRSKIIQHSNAEEIGFIYIDETSEDKFDVLDGSTKLFNTDVGVQLVSELKEMIGESAEPIYSGDYTEVNLNDFHSLMVFPMIHSGMNLGFIVVLAKEKYYFTFEIFKLINTLIQHSSIAIANTILTQQLEISVITDHLTKLYSRKYLEEKAGDDMVVGTGGVLMLFDIDDFKKINDYYGHYEGDRVLGQVAYALRQEVKENAIPARWGGEELAVYVPEMDLDSGFMLAERIRRAIETSTNPSVTVSGGISAWRNKVNHSVEKLFIEADNALYSAKNAGKNRVFLS